MTIEFMRKQENINNKQLIDFLENEILIDLNLKECIEKTKLTINNCYDFIKSEAQKSAVDNCAIIDSDTVFGLVKHFFMEYKEFEKSKHTTSSNNDIQRVKPDAPKADLGEWF